MRPRGARTRRPELGVLLVVVLASACSRGLLEDDGPYPEVQVTIGDDVVVAEVADTPARRHRGLSGRPGLGPHRGMLFFYDPPQQPAFVMRDMRFAIDIVWIRAGRIVDLTHEASHRVGFPLPRHRPRAAIDHVLEVAAGTARRRGWAIGERVTIE